MSLFVLAMIIGLGGLLLMALPGIRRGHGHLHAGSKLGHRLGQARTGAAKGRGPKAGSHTWIPEPRALLTLLALFGAFGDVARGVLHWKLWADCLVAMVPALAIEMVLVGPLWRTALRFQGRPSSPLEGLVLEEAQAVTVFRNGRGIVQLVRDGRVIQFAAELVDGELDRAVKVGERLKVREVDPLRERVLVARL